MTAANRSQALGVSGLSTNASKLGAYCVLSTSVNVVPGTSDTLVTVSVVGGVGGVVLLALGEIGGQTQGVPLMVRSTWCQLNTVDGERQNVGGTC